MDELPLVYQQRAKKRRAQAPAKNETAWQKLLREIWQDAKQLVRIEDTGKAEIPLLPLNQEFSCAKTSLRLLSARLALLSRDEVSGRIENCAALTRAISTANLEVMRTWPDE